MKSVLEVKLYDGFEGIHQVTERRTALHSCGRAENCFCVKLYQARLYTRGYLNHGGEVNLDVVINLTILNPKVASKTQCAWKESTKSEN